MTTIDVTDRYTEGLGRLERLVLARDRCLDTLRGEANVAISSVHSVCDIDPSKLRITLEQIVDLEGQVRALVEEINACAEALRKERVRLVPRNGGGGGAATIPRRTH